MADIEALTSLATRLEQAGPESHAELLWEVWVALKGDPQHTYDYSRFKTMLDCGAYLSAAEMLVPEKCDFRVDRLGEGKACAWVWLRSNFDAVLGHEASTTALALAAAACCRAIAGKGS